VVFQPSFGLYIARDSVNLVLLGKSLKGPKVVASATKALDPEAGLYGKVTSAFQLLDEFATRHRVGGGNLYVGFASELASLRHLSMPTAVKQNLRASLGYEIENFVPLSADNLFFDYQVLDENKKEKTLDLLLVAVRKESVERILEAAAGRGYRVDGIETGATALANAFFSLGPLPDDEEHVYGFFEKSWGEMAIMKKGALVYGTGIEIPSSSVRISSLAKTHLERILRAVGLEPSGTSVVISGPGLTGELVEELRAEGFRVTTLSGVPNALSSHGLVLAYGLALRPFLRLPVMINLVPPWMRRKPSRVSHYTMIVLSGLLAVLLMGWWGSEIVLQRRLASELDRQLAQLEKKVQTVEVKRKRCEDLVRKIQRLQQIIHSPVEPLDILREMTEIIPQGAWITELEISDKKVTVTGYAEVATELIPLLEDSPLFHDVAFLSPVSKTREGKERFRIALKID